MTSLRAAQPGTTDRLAAAAAFAVLATLPAAEPLVPGEPGDDAACCAVDGQAVSARFSGAASGEVVVVVGRAIVDALAASPLGSLDLAAALRPALQAAAGVVGDVVLGPAQVLDPRPALDALLAKPDAAVVPLLADGEPRAAVGLAVTSAPAPEPAAAPRLAGLELLRNVEMDVTAELGRARMTLGELLSLTAGAVIELDRAAGAPADLLVNGRLIARGEVVVIDENFGVRITEIVSDETR